MKDTIYAYFNYQAHLRPYDTACFDEQRSLSYSDLQRLADTIISQFPKQKTKRIGIVCDHSVEMIAAILAVVKCGCAYVPIEPSFPDNRIEFVMDECDVDFIITNPQYASRFGNRKTLLISPGMAIDPAAKHRDKSRTSDIAYILYTSGSTGLPKGVMVTNSNVCHYVRAFIHEFHPGAGDVMMQHSVCSFDIFVEEVFTTLLSGACLAIPSTATKADVNLLMDFVRRHGVTMISGFPYLLLDFNKLDKIPESLRLLISGGDVLRYSYIDRLLPQVKIYNTYGPSETTVCASYQRCNDCKPEPDGTYPIGYPVTGAEIRICDSQGREMPDGQAGEICIIGGGVSEGYIGDRKKENEAFVILPDGRRMYRSGDWGTRLPNGQLLFHHRIDSQVMILGRRVETCEVENVLCQCPEIESGVVTANNDDKGLSYLTAYCVPKNIKNFSLKSLRQKMAKFLPDYMIPEFFVTLRLIPQTPNGKTDYRALPVIPKHNTL